MKKKILFSCLTLLFLVSAISGLGSGNFVGSIGCLVIAAIFGFLAYRTIKPQHNIETDAASAAVQSNTSTPPEKFQCFRAFCAY